MAALLAACGLVAWAATASGSGGAPGPAGGSRAPLPPAPADVLLVTIDTLRADALGFAGNRLVATPTLDRLAAGGRVFTAAHAHNVVTLPSHTNILTGLYPYQHGIRDNSGFVLSAAVPTLGTWLRQAGYSTAAFVGAFPLDSRFGLGRGFDVYDDAYPLGSRPDDYLLAERRGDQVVGAALAWWNAKRGSRRFLWVHLYDPHAPYQPPEPFASRFHDHPYLGEVAAVDSFLTPLLGPILDHKEPAALVVVTSDHGEALGDHGELTHGLFAYEATLKVPLVVWGPGISPARDPRPARHVDIVPTVLTALRLQVPPGLPGRSLLGPPPPVQAEGGGAAAAGSSYFEALSTSLNRGWAPLRGLLNGPWKLIDLPLPELYRLADDPGENHNLIDSDRRTARALAAELPKEASRAPERGAVTAEEAARLASLGYAQGTAPPKAAYTAEDDPKRLVAVDREMHRAVELYSRGRYADSAAAAREVIAARPGLGEAYVQQALALRHLERQDEAIAVLRQAIEHGAGDRTVRRQLGLALAEAGRPGEAVQQLRPLAAAGAADPDSLNALGIALSDAGKNDEAAATLKQVTAAYPRDPKAYENLGIVALRRERPEEARGLLEQALHLNDQLPIAWNTLGVALYQLHHPAAALNAWERSVALDPAQYDALYNIGLVAAEEEQTAQAREAFRRFVATAPAARFRSELARARALLEKLGG